MFNLRQRLAKILACSISVAVILTSSRLAEAAPSVMPDALERFAPARGLGYVSDRYHGSTDRTVVLIQDLHLHYPTQKRIVKMLEQLYAKGYVSGPLAIEGIEGPHDTSIVASYPAGKPKAKLTDYFMKKGELSAPEAFSILRGEGHLLHGIEKAEYYDLNRNLFRASREDRTKLQNQLTRLQSGLDLLKHKQYSYALRRLDKEESYSMASAEKLLDEKLALCPDEMTKNIVTADQMLHLTKRLVHQEVTLEEARYIAQRLPAFVSLLNDLLKSDAGAISVSNLQETLKASIDFYLVALMRNQPMADHALALLKETSVLPMVAGGFHTAGLTKAFKKAGVSYVVITPLITEIPDADYRSLYEGRLAGAHLSKAQLAHDFGIAEMVAVTADLSEGGIVAEGFRRLGGGSGGNTTLHSGLGNIFNPDESLNPMKDRFSRGGGFEQRMENRLGVHVENPNVNVGEPAFVYIGAGESGASDRDEKIAELKRVVRNMKEPALADAATLVQLAKDLLLIDREVQDATLALQKAEEFLSAEAARADSVERPVPQSGRELEEGALAVAITLGGTNVRIEVVDHRGSTKNPKYQMTLQWGDIARHFKKEKGEISEMFKDVAPYLGGAIGAFLADRGILSDRIAELGISFAGPTNGDLVYSTNMAVHFRNDNLAEVLLKNIPGFADVPARTLNDGETFVLGEMNDEEGSMKDGNGIGIILGTGVGGAMLKNGKIDRSVREFGHVLLRKNPTTKNTSGEYVYWSVEELGQKKLFIDGKFYLPKGYTYFEHRVAGPWAAIRFLDEVVRPKPGFLSYLAQATGARYEDLVKLMVTGDPLENGYPINLWGEKADEDTVKAVNKFLLDSSKVNTELGRAARAFELSLQKEIAEALTALRPAAPGVRLVLGSSLAELRRNDQTFTDQLTQIGPDVLISKLNSSREAAAFAPPAGVTSEEARRLAWETRRQLLATLGKIVTGIFIVVGIGAVLTGPSVHAASFGDNLAQTVKEPGSTGLAQMIAYANLFAISILVAWISFFRNQRRSAWATEGTLEAAFKTMSEAKQSLVQRLKDINLRLRYNYGEFMITLMSKLPGKKGEPERTVEGVYKDFVGSGA